MSPILNLLIFGGLSVAMLLLSIFTITTKSLLRSATCLLLVLICTAGLYLMLNYHFLAAIQVSVYAGGVVVLFVFAIFLTAKEDEVLKLTKSYKKYIYAILIALVGVLVVAFALLKTKFVYANISTSDAEMSMKEVATNLMGTGKYQYLLPFEVMSVLLLATIIGGLVIAKKDKKNEDETESQF